MSHSGTTSKCSSTPSAHSAQQRPYISPLNALSNRSAQPYAAPSSNLFLANNLIPRDYLASRSQATSAANSVLRGSPLASQAGSFEEGSAKDGQSTHHASLDKVSGQDIEGATGKENLDIDDDLKVQRAPSPESEATTAAVDSTVLTSKPATALSSRSLHNDMPRTSSIDSAISSVSASSQRKEQGEPRDPSPTSIRSLIATAGSAENLVLHLLKEKNHVASQNNQLWKLVEKQRALLLGLNKDLERVSKDRDRCKKKLKEMQAQGALPRAAAISPSQESIGQHDDNAVKPPGIPHHELPSRQTASLETSSSIDAPGPAIITTEDLDAGPRPDSRGARPVLQAQIAGLIQPSLALTEATPLNEKPGKGFSALRKTAPKPLNLLQNNNDTIPQTLLNANDRASLSDEDEEQQQRGRRKTRAEDDQDREKSLKKEQEPRSKSKKMATAPAESESQIVEAPVTVAVTLPASPRPPHGLAPPKSLQPISMHERLLPMPIRSPGLPASPRPMMSNTMSSTMSNTTSSLGSLPMSPRAPPPGPLSPRAPKQPIPPPMMSPSPFTDPAIIQRQNAMARQATQQSYQQSDRLQVHEPTTSNDVPPVFQGLVSSQYPNLLLPPNALPSIQIQVASSRLRPPRHSMLGIRTQEDSTVFSLSIYSRASRNELWRIEKIPAVLPQLDQQLRTRCKTLPRLPDKKLFSGHSPVVIDARRQAIDAYFEDLLDIEMDEPSALIICRFLSTDVLDPSTEPTKHPGVNSESLPQSTSMDGKVVKTGFLTKRGKNFGGWKSRYFVLDSPDLKYYETPGGPQIGSIKISHAKIGSQKVEDATSTDPEDQYRHAFLVQEPKKKDTTIYVRHVLCAENDADRDQWVSALLHYVDDGGQKGLDSPTLSTNASVTSRPTTSTTRDRTIETHSDTPSPSSPTSLTDTSISDTMSRNANISKPMNGAPIQDSTQWGNKTSTQQLKEKSSKMGSIFHFKKGSQEHLNGGTKLQETGPKPRVLRHNGYVRAVFGLPLADAVEFCSPFNVDVQLPAVVFRSIEYLRYRHAANEEGLFRLSGSNIVVKHLKERFNSEGDVDLVDDDDEQYDVHAVASLFKTYLRELPSPLLTRELQIEFLNVLELDTQAEKVAAFSILVRRLPKVNFELLRIMSEYLLEVTENAGKNKMSVRNMGIVFSPTVNIPTPVFNLFLSEYHAIFETDTTAQSIQQPQVRQNLLHAPTGLAAGDVRSPRHQMFSDIPTLAYDQTNFNDTLQTAHSGPNVRSHQTSGSGEFGFIPLHPSYENGSYVSHPQEVRTQAFNPPPTQAQLEGEEHYGSLNRIMVPQGATTDRRRKRESAMLF